MSIILHQLNGQNITLHISRRAKTNIILRPHSSGSLKISMPSWLSQSDLQQWLNRHPELLQQMLDRAPLNGNNTFGLPETIWYQGRRFGLQTHIGNTVAFEPEQAVFRLPKNQTAQQQARLLAAFLYRQAALNLLPLLQEHAVRMKLQPAAVKLTRAKTFWGVCRAKTGIRLNWRLIGAPDFVQEYVCVHELCHLPHPNHSKIFWQTVRRHTPHTDAAQNWLKAHGKELFALG